MSRLTSCRKERTRFVLNDEGSAAADYGKDKSLPLLFSVNYEPWPMSSVSAFFGVEFDGQLRLEDEDSQVITREDYDVAPMIGLAFRSRFR